jgi:hypothetical protein
MSLPKLLERVILTDHLFLDPNNPRFLDLSDEIGQIPSERICEPKVQEKALQRMLDVRYDVKQLKDSIRSIGFLKVDRLVVLPLPQDGDFVVVEGNRRLAAAKSLLNEHESGEITLTEGVHESLHALSVVVIDGANTVNHEHLARILQGIRHVARVRDWGPYQQAQLIAIMIDDGKESTEISEVLGLSMRRINQLRRGYYALKQMRDDPEFAEYASTKLFSHFDEAFKLPKVREWMQWDDKAQRFLDDQNRRSFYCLLVGEESDGERLPSRLNDPKSIREMGELMEDQVRFKQFLATPTLSLSDALHGIVTAERKVDWRGGIRQLMTLMRQIPAVDLLDASPDDVTLLSTARDLCDSLSRQARSGR